MNGPRSMGDLMREHEDALIADAARPERIAADDDLIERNRAKLAAETESLRRQGLIDDGFKVGDPVVWPNGVEGTVRGVDGDLLLDDCGAWIEADDVDRVDL